MQIRKGSQKSALSRYPDANIIYNREVNIRQEAARCIIVEFPPAVRPIFEDMADSGNRTLRKLSFPFVYLVIFVRDNLLYSVGLYYRNTNPTKRDRRLYLPNLPNTSGEGLMCIPRLILDWDERIEDFAGRVVEEFWTGTFSRDIRNLWVYYCGHYVYGFPSSFSQWEEKTAEDPAFITRLKWDEALYSLDNVSQRFE